MPAIATRAATSIASSAATSSVEPRRLSSPGSALSYGWVDATCRKADSACTSTKCCEFSTANVAFAVSATCQTMIAAMLTGLPSESLTFSSWVSKLLTFTDTRRFDVNGVVSWRPGLRIVPT